MASFEGPAPPVGGAELSGVAPSPMTTGEVPSQAPSLTPQRAQQELARLTALIKGNPNLGFLEPRVVKCMESGTQDSMALLSFYRLISQSLSEELVEQKERIEALENKAADIQQRSSQDEMAAALAEAAEAVTRVSAGSTPNETPDAAAPSNDMDDSAQVEQLRRELEQANVQRERLLQDVQNIRNRHKIDVDVRVFKEIEKFTQTLLPAVDAFHQAMPVLRSATDPSSVVTGVEMIHEQLMSALTQAGLQKLEVVGTVFDPHLHEAIGEVETHDTPDDHVYDELQPGYMLGERLLRAAIVRVARNSGPAPAAAPVAPPAVAPASPPPKAPAAPVAEPTPTPVTEPAAPVAEQTPVSTPVEQTSTPQVPTPPAQPTPTVAPATESASPPTVAPPVVPQPAAAAQEAAQPPSDISPGT